MTVATWGVYGIFLQMGQIGMKDAAGMPDHAGRFKAFLFVGIAYFLTAVLAPLALLTMRGTDWRFPAGGSLTSLLAGIVGAIGAFAVLLAFGAGGQPAVVMTIIFAGAPIVNAVVSLLKDPPKDGWGSIHWAFFTGLLLAIVGAALVTMFKPAPPGHGAAQANFAAWLTFALLTVAAWGVYGILLHMGQVKMRDPKLGRYKAFLFVGIAYFLTAVVAPLAVLWMRNSDWHFSAAGSWLSLLAGVVGAIGAFAVLLAFGAGGKPPVVMTIIFAGAPIVTAVVGLLKAPPTGGWGAIPWEFFAGIVLAIVGAALVTMFKPASAAHPVPAARAEPVEVRA